MRRLIEVLGEEEAETLMESLPPVVWQNLATKDDLTELKADVTQLKADVTELKADVTQLKADVTQLKAEFTGLKGEFAGLRAEFKAELTLLRGEFALQLARTTRTMVFAFIAVSIAMLAAMTAIVRTAPV